MIIKFYTRDYLRFVHNVQNDLHKMKLMTDHDIQCADYCRFNNKGLRKFKINMKKGYDCSLQ